jgi:hypothetical protein
MGEASHLRVASPAVQGPSHPAPAVLACPLTDPRLRAGSRPGRDSTAHLVISLPTCTWVLLDSKTSTSHRQVLVEEHRVVILGTRVNRPRNPTLPRRMAPLSLQRPRQMLSRLEKLLRLHLPLSRLHHRPLSPSPTSQPLWHRRTPSPLSRVVRRRLRVDRRAASYQQYPLLAPT